jgi:3',5'-cyclic AMP phosphodiesterase CpdA
MKPPGCETLREMGMRVTVVSDSHLSDLNPAASRHWDAVVGHLAADPPDLVVHAGDAALDAGRAPAELRVVRQAMNRVPVPWTIVPGNHDLDGDVEGDDAASLARFRAEVGPDRFSVALGAWRVLGVNAMTLGTGSTAEAEQWDWLAAELRPGSGPVLMVLHKPVVRPPVDRRPNPQRYVPEPAGSRLLTLLAAATERPLVVSGHVHQYLQHERDGITHVWAPATWATLPDRIQPPVGDKVIGVLALTLHDDGRHEVELHHPGGRREAMLGVDVDDPYARLHA